MLTIAVLPWVVFMLCASITLVLVRVCRGPNDVDRVLAIDVLTLLTIALLVTLGIARDERHYFEAAALLAVVACVSTLAIARYLLRGRVIE